MRLISEIVRAIGAEELSPRIRYTVTDGGGGYFQNVKRLLEFSSTRIVLGGKGGKVSVEGEGLELGKCFEGDVAILGRIDKVEGETCARSK